MASGAPGSCQEQALLAFLCHRRSLGPLPWTRGPGGDRRHQVGAKARGLLSHGLPLCALPSSLKPFSGQAGHPAAKEQEPLYLVRGGCGLVRERRRPAGSGAPCGALPEACTRSGGPGGGQGAAGGSALCPGAPLKGGQTEPQGSQSGPTT